MAAQLEARISGQDELSSVLKSVGASAGGLSDAFKLVGIVALGTFVGDLAGQALEGIKTFVEDGLKEVIGKASEAQDTMARLDAVLKASAGASGMTHDSLVALGQSLQDTTTYSHTTAESAEAVLLRFHTLGADVFPQALKVSADMAAVMGIDLPSAAQALGKALEDPGVGLLRLKQYGLDLSASQLETIKELMGTSKELANVAKQGEAAADTMPNLKSQLALATDALVKMEKGGKSSADQIDAQKLKISDLKQKIDDGTLAISAYNAVQGKNVEGMSDAERHAMAQKIILDALTGSIGGAAEAMGNTFSGNVEKLKNKFSDLQEQVGNVFLPVLTDLTKRVGTFLNSSGFKEGFAAFIDGLRSMLERGIALGTSLVEYLAEAWQRVQGGLSTLKGYLDQATAFFRGTIGTIISYFQQNGWLGLAELFWAWAKTAAGWATDKLGAIAEAFLEWITNPSTIEKFKNIAFRIGQIIGDGLVALLGLAGRIGTAILTLGETLQTAANDSNFVGTLMKIGAGIAHGLADGISTSALKDVDWNKVGGNLMQGLGDGIRAWAEFERGLSMWIVEHLVDFASLAGGYIQFMTKAANWLREQLWDAIKSVNWGAVGGDVIDGIVKGITDGGYRISGALSNAVQAALTAAKNALGIHSPSTLFAEQMGGPIAQGIAAGIWQNSGLVSSAISGATGGLGGLSAGYGIGGSRSSVVNNSPSYNLHINTSAPYEPIVQDFQMLAMIAR